MKLQRSFLSIALMLVAAFASAQTPPPTNPPTNPTGTTQSPEEKLVSKEDKVKLLADLRNIIENQAFVPGLDLKQWSTFLEKHQEELDKAEKEADLSRTINRALRDFGISHIRFLTPRQADNRTRTSVISIGANTRLDNGALVVTSVTPKSPAEEAGIKQGDLITTVDGKAPEGPAVLTGEVGTEVKLKVKSGADEREVVVKRARVSIARLETLTWVDEETAVLKVFTFSNGYSRTNIDTLMKQANEKAKYVIIDLRSNGGGSVANLRHLLGLFVDSEKEVGTFVGRNDQRDYEKDHTPSTDPITIASGIKRKYKPMKHDTIVPFKGKVAVLINRGSASASEIFAMGLRETINAPVIGTKSAGAVLASVFGRLHLGFQIQYPIQDYVSIKGVRLEKNPIVPDVEVTTTTSAEGKDTVVEKAVEKLKAVSN